MNYDYQQDPNQQNQQGNQYGQDPNQQNQQGNQYGQDPNQQYQQRNQYGQDPNQQSQQGGQYDQGQFSGARQVADQQINQAIDQFANKIPGGPQPAGQGKDVGSGILGNLENQAEQRLGGGAGGML